jgi:hypothetical protein
VSRLYLDAEKRQLTKEQMEVYRLKVEENSVQGKP